MTNDDATAPDRYLHGHAEPVIASYVHRTAEDCAAYLIDVLRPGFDLLDVGCGPGTITAGLAERVAPGRVIAIDSAADVVERASRELADRGIAAECRTGNVYALDLPDDSIDVAHAHQVLQHLSDPVAALREMRRVVRPGGWIAVRDADYSAMFHSPASPTIERWHELYDAAARAVGGEPDAGRHLPAWFRSAGLPDITVTSRTWTRSPGAGLSEWCDMWSKRIVDSDFTGVVGDHGLAVEAELSDLALGWAAFGNEPDGLFVIPHVEVLAKVA